MRINGFDTAVLEPGTDIVLVGDLTTYRSDDEETHSSSVLRSSRLTGTFGKDQKTLDQLAAQGNVRFEHRQPYASGKGTELTTVTATKADLINTKGAEVIQVPGPLLIERSVQDKQKPDSIQGSAGDTVTFNVTTGGWKWDSPNGTALVTLAGDDAISEKKTTVRGPTEPAKKHNK